MAWTYGVNSVTELLERDPDSVDEVWIVKSRKPGQSRKAVQDLARKSGVRFKLVDSDAMTSAVGDRHQGVAARRAEFTYADEAEMLRADGQQLIMVLDGVQDTGNLGAILRSACALGASGVVIPRHRSASVTAVAQKTSSGASERIPVAQVTNVANFLGDAKDAGFWVYGAAADGEVTSDQVSFADRAVLVLGGESSGIRRLVRSKCDVIVQIPMPEFESLNVSVAAGIMLYAWGCSVRAQSKKG